MKTKNQVLNEASKETERMLKEVSEAKDTAGIFRSDAISSKYSHHMAAMKRMGLIRMISRGVYHIPRPLKASETIALTEMVVETRQESHRRYIERQKYKQEVTLPKIKFEGEHESEKEVTPPGWIPLLDTDSVHIGQSLFCRKTNAFYQVIAKGNGGLTAVSKMARTFTDPDGWLVEETKNG